MAHFGRYELLTRLGEGSHAVTWRARLEGVATDVILKLVHPQRDPNFLATFLDEARGVATLSHGNIARLLDFGHEGATCFLVRQLVHGQTLEAVLERAKVKGCPFVPTPVALHIAAKVCDALQYAHSCTELHGEVSPTNVLIGYYGEVKLADFVVARAAQIDSRSDICATGATLYQMLCGQLPAGQLPRALNHRLSPFVAAAVVKAMSAASDGFATAQELGSALKDALAATDPSFTPDRVMRFVDWLFAAELIAEGRGFEPSEEFEAWLDGWLEKKPPSVSVRLPASAQVPVEASAAKVPTEGKLNFKLTTWVVIDPICRSWILKNSNLFTGIAPAGI